MDKPPRWLIDTRSSVERAALARKTFKDVRPQIRALFRRARLHHTLQIEIAYGVVETLMSAALASSISLMPQAKLEDKDVGIAYHSLAVSALMIAFARNRGETQKP
jgi:hypothetical protein